MKITKQIKDLGEQGFVCPNCKTEFIASKKEYRQTIGNEEKRIGPRNWFLSHLIRYESIPSFILDVKCPSCLINLTKYIPTGETTQIVEHDFGE